MNYLIEYDALGDVGGDSLARLDLYAFSVIGGQTAVGQVTLDRPLPGGAYVTLSSSDAAVAVPASVFIPEGSQVTSFPITTFPVAVPTAVLIRAFLHGSVHTATLLVLPGGHPTPGGNLLINGSFETPYAGSSWTNLRDGQLPGWRITHGDVDVVGSGYWPAAPGQGRRTVRAFASYTTLVIADQTT